MQKTIHKSISNLTAKKRKAFCALVPMVAIGVLAGILATAMVGQAENTYATDASGNGNLDFSISSEKSIGVTLSTTSVALQINPTASGQFGRSSMTVDVSTNNTTGYNLTMKANTATLTRSAKVNGTDYTINPLGANVTCSSESETSCAGWAAANNNQWGYRVDGGSDTTVANVGYYSSMSGAVSEAKVIKNTEGPANSSLTTIYFGSQLTNSIPTGSYEGVTLSFIATTNLTPVYMQTVTASELAELMPNTNDTTVVRDSRDEKDYTIAKLADGNYWMLDNLALDISDSSVQSKMSADTTNANAQSISCLLTGQYNSATCGSPFSTAAVAVGMTADYTKPYIYTALMTETGDVSKQYGNGSHAYGVLYNYCAASAGSYCYASGSGTGNATQDVCPKNWRMPTGNSGGEYGVLRSTINNNTASNAASLQALLSTPLSGYFRNGSLGNQGSLGYFWSSTRNDGNYMYYLRVDATSTDATNYFGRNRGFAMRCIFAAS